MSLRPNAVPLRPDYSASTSTITRSLDRGMALAVLSDLGQGYPDAIAQKAGWEGDTLARAVAVPTSTSTSGLANTRKFSLASVAPSAITARLFDSATHFDSTGVATIEVEGVSLPVPPWVIEGGPIPIVQGSTAPAATIGPPKKMAFGFGVSGWLEYATPELASVIIGRKAREVAAKSLDASVWDDSASSSSRDAGLLHGVTAITSASSFTSALQAAAAAIAAAGLDPSRLMIFASTKQAIALQMLAGPRFNYPIISAPQFPDGQLVIVDPVGIGVAYDGEPEIETSTQATAHYDSSPSQISSVGTPPTIAAPVRSTFQEGGVLVKLRMKLSFGVIALGAVQLVTGAEAW